MCCSSDPGELNGPSYLLEHLATFRVAEDSDLLYPADGMRRLLHMEKTTGIWTQKMQLRLERNWVLILSHENQVTMATTILGKLLLLLLLLLILLLLILLF